MRAGSSLAHRTHLSAALAAVALLLPLRADAYELSQGRYLTAEEYAKLSKDEALEYCQQLAQEIDIQNDNAAAASSETADLDEQIADLRARLAEVKSTNEQSAADILELEGQAKEPAQPAAHVVVEGEWLMRIAGLPGVYGDKSQWKRIWEANRERVPNPDLIHPGLELVIPR